MKNQFTSRIVKLTFAFMFVLIASSCSQDDEAMDAAVLAQENNSEISAKSAKVSAAAAESFNVPNEICAGVAAEFCLNFPQATKGNGDPKETNVQVQLLVDGDDPDTLVVETKYFMKIGGGNYNVEYCFSYTFTTAGEYTLRYKIGDGGFLPSNEGMTVTVDNCGCPYDGNAFTGAAVSCGASREANFTFSSEDGVGSFKMQGGLTNFTGDDAVVTIWNGLTEVTGDYTITQKTPGGSSNRVITVEGALSECGSIRVNIKWDSTNSGSVITGAWSVKDGDDNELAPDVLGLVCD